VKHMVSLSFVRLELIQLFFCSNYPSAGRHRAHFGMKGYVEDSDSDMDVDDDFGMSVDDDSDMDVEVDVTVGDAMEHTFVHELGECASRAPIVQSTNCVPILGHMFGLQHEHQRPDSKSAC
jgi:hypothetical protein